MFSRVAVTVLLLLLQCEESTQIRIPNLANSVDSTPDATTGAVTVEEPTPPPIDVNDGDDEGRDHAVFASNPPITEATTEAPSTAPPLPGEPIPPLDFDMNAIAQISSFPFAKDSDDPFHKLITTQYVNNADADISLQKCYLGDLKAGPEVRSDTRMGTPLVDLNGKETKDLKATDCKGGLRHQLSVAEPSFPSRLHCESCSSSSDQYPTEFYHLQGYNKPSAPKLDTLSPVTFGQLLHDGDLPAGSKLPLGAWADPQYSYQHRLRGWDNIVGGSTLIDEKTAAFVIENPLRPSSIDRFLINGLPSAYKDLLTAFNADGAVRLLSSPLPTGNARPRHLTLACAQVQSTSTVVTDSITHVEFIGIAKKIAGNEVEAEVRHHPQYDSTKEGEKAKWEKTENEKVLSAKKFPEGYAFSDWTMYDKKRFEKKDASSSILNLRLSVHFSSFSCCSSCCCSREQCGKKMGTKPSTCYNLKSTKTRIGHLVVKKVDKSKAVTMTDVIPEGLSEFNSLLSQEPFATVGLPLYSQRFRHANWLTIQKKLLDKVAGFGKLLLDKDGNVVDIPRFVETVDCVDKEKDCDNWTACRGFPRIPKVPFTPDDDDDPSIPTNTCLPSSIPGLKEIKLEKNSNDFNLKEGDAVRVVAVVLGDSEVRWTVGENAVQMMNESKSCEEQENIFVDTNRRDLIIRYVTPLISNSPIEAKSANASARMNVVVEKKSWWKDKKVYFILAAVLIVLVVVGVIAFCCWWKCLRGRGCCKGGKSSNTEGSTKRTNKRKGKASKKDSKEGDEHNSGSDKELTQNPGGSARPAWRVEKKTEKEGTTKETAPGAPPAAGDDFFATPDERGKPDAPAPGTPGQKDPLLAETDKENANGAVKTDEVPKTERLSGPIGNQVFGIPTGDPAASPAAAAAASPNVPDLAAAAAAIPALPSKQSEKEEEKSSSKSSSKSDGKGDDKDHKKKGEKKDKKKDPKKKDGKKDKKKNDKKDGSKKKTTKKSAKKPTPKKKSPKKKVSAKPKKSTKKTVTRKKK